MTSTYLFVSFILWLFGGFPVIVDLLNKQLNDPMTVIQVFWLGFVLSVVIDVIKWLFS